MDGTCGFPSLINGQPSSPNGYLQRFPPSSTCKAFSIMDNEHPRPPHESLPQSVAYENNETLVAAMAAEDASYLLMEVGNIGQYLGEDVWYSECGIGKMQVPEMEYYKLQKVEQPGGYGITNMQEKFGDKRLQQQLQRQYNNVIVGECSRTTPLVSEITTFEESSFKVGRLSAEEKKEKINRYMKKRSERNFSKKIKYACRKTLADSRPRVRGRFAKNEEFGEVTTSTGSQIYDDDDGDEVMMLEEYLINPSDILANVSEVISFKHNYTTL